MSRQFRGRVEGGKIKLLPEERARMDAFTGSLKDGRWVQITLTPLPKRSHAQLGYYWACVVPEMREAFRSIGHELTDDETHHFLKTKFNPQHLVSADGEVIGEYGGSTTDMNITDFMAYLDKILRWAAEFLSVTISPPNSQSSFTFNE